MSHFKLFDVMNCQAYFIHCWIGLSSRYGGNFAESALLKYTWRELLSFEYKHVLIKITVIFEMCLNSH